MGFHECIATWSNTMSCMHLPCNRFSDHPRMTCPSPTSISNQRSTLSLQYPQRPFSNMVQNLSTSTPVTFLFPDILVDWPYESLLHPDYGTVDLESANWVNDSHLFSQSAQQSFDKSLFGPRSMWFVVVLGCLLCHIRSPGLSCLSSQYKRYLLDLPVSCVQIY